MTQLVIPELHLARRLLEPADAAEKGGAKNAVRPSVWEGDTRQLMRREPTET